MKETYNYEDLLKIVKVLRSETGCPWDRKQTHESLKTCLIEEAYEVCEAIDILQSEGDSENLCEELGDLMLQVVMHSQIAAEENEFTMEEVIDGISKKMIRRHPHVFDPEHADKISEDTQLREQWEEIKKAEKKMESLEEQIQSIPKAFPALIRAQKVMKKAFAYEGSKGNMGTSIGNIRKCLNTLENTQKSEDDSSVQDAFSKLLFETVKMASILQLNAENSLTNATNEFINRLIDAEHEAVASDTHL